MINHQGGNSACGIGPRQPGEIEKFLHHIQSVEMDDAGRRAVAGHGFRVGREKQRRQAGVVPIVAIGNFNPFNRTVLALDALAEHVEHTIVSLDPDRGFGLTHAFCSHVVDRRTFVLGAGAEPASGGIVLVSQTLTAFPEHHPARVPGIVGGIVIGTCNGLEWLKRLVHFREHSAGIDRHHGGHRPGIIVGEIFKHHGGVLLSVARGLMPRSRLLFRSGRR